MCVCFQTRASKLLRDEEMAAIFLNASDLCAASATVLQALAGATDHRDWLVGIFV
jgi:hypothetical protein